MSKCYLLISKFAILRIKTILLSLCNSNMVKFTLTSQASKNMRDMKYITAIHDGRQSVARYIRNTHPSCEAASYTVKKLVAVMRNRIKVSQGAGHTTT